MRRAEHHFIATHSLEEGFQLRSIRGRRHSRCSTNSLQSIAWSSPSAGRGSMLRPSATVLDALPEADTALRKELSRRLREEGAPMPFAEQLRQLDPEYYRQVDTKTQPACCVRWRCALTTGKPYSTLRTGVKQERPFRIVMIGTELNREELYSRIDRRVDMMMEAGLEQEARAVYPLRHLNSLQTVGYRELFEYFDGKISREEAVELHKTRAAMPSAS